MAIQSESTLFDLAERQMVDRVQQHVIDSLVKAAVEDFTEKVTGLVKRRVAEYAITGIAKVEDMMTLTTNYNVYINGKLAEEENSGK